MSKQVFLNKSFDFRRLLFLQSCSRKFARTLRYAPTYVLRIFIVTICTKVNLPA
jgi:hypothetical protein